MTAPVPRISEGGHVGQVAPGVAGAAGMADDHRALSDGAVRQAASVAGDEGGVLVGEHNPEYLEFVACCDVRPTNKRRIFDGEPGIIVGREVGGTSNNYPGAGRRFGETARIVGGNDPLRFRATPASKCRSGQ